MSDYRMVHKTVKAVARGIAGEYYEYAASHQKHGNLFYAEYPSQSRFIAKQWREFVTAAKALMTDMLSNQNTPAAYRDEIYHALLLDATLPYSVQETQFARPN